MSFFQSCGKLPTTVLAVKTANDIKRIIAFAFNEKKLCNCLNSFFFLLFTFSGRTAKSFLVNVLLYFIKKACDQDLTRSLDTLRSFRKNCSSSYYL